VTTERRKRTEGESRREEKGFGGEREAAGAGEGDIDL